jgi:hypothetical protein
MMIDLNPLSVLKQRKMKFIPPHFVKTKISESFVWDNSVENWVTTKLKGRYCITKFPMIDENGKLKSASILALEDQKEMTYFMLACPYTRR